MIRLVVFDLAGTTVRDDGHVAAAFTEALAAHGIAISPDELVRVRGASKREAVRRLVPEDADHAARADRVYADFRARLSARLDAPGGVGAARHDLPHIPFECSTNHASCSQRLGFAFEDRAGLEEPIRSRPGQGGRGPRVAVPADDVCSRSLLRSR